MKFNYFSYLCFIWAIIGITTRILMAVYGERWNKWEMDQAYKEVKPKWIYLISLLGILLVAFTWYQVFNLDVEYSWIIALLLSLTLVKISALLFNYEKFRAFASETLNNPKKKLRLNISVFIVSIVMILLGLFVYS
jgi:hypothetical protein